jgi:hypothetical protein
VSAHRRLELAHDPLGHARWSWSRAPVTACHRPRSLTCRPYPLWAPSRSEERVVLLVALPISPSTPQLACCAVSPSQAPSATTGWATSSRWPRLGLCAAVAKLEGPLCHLHRAPCQASFSTVRTWPWAAAFGPPPVKWTLPHASPKRQGLLRPIQRLPQSYAWASTTGRRLLAAITDTRLCRWVSLHSIAQNWSFTSLTCSPTCFPQPPRRRCRESAESYRRPPWHHASPVSLGGLLAQFWPAQWLGRTRSHRGLGP